MNLFIIRKFVYNITNQHQMIDQPIFRATNCFFHFLCQDTYRNSEFVFLFREQGKSNRSILFNTLYCNMIFNIPDISCIANSNQFFIRRTAHCRHRALVNNTENKPSRYAAVRNDYISDVNIGYSNPRPIAGDEYVMGELNLTLASAIQSDSGRPQSDSRESENKGEQGYRISSRSLPNGFAFIVLVAGFLGFIVTMFFLNFGRSISGLPSKNTNPKKTCEHKSEDDLTPNPSRHSNYPPSD